MIDLDQVRTFVAVIESGSFQEAARHLGIAQPTASLHVQKLEATLGHALIERRRSGAGTTAPGARFLPFARTLLRVSERAQAALDRGGLTIGASSNIGIYLLQPLARAFQSAHPTAGPLDIRIASNLETVRRLEDSEIDIALMEWWDDRPGFRARIWRREELVVIVAPDHPWARRRSIDKSALLAEPLIGGESGTGTQRLLQDALALAPGALKAGLQLGSTEAVKQAVRAGLGVSITLASAVRDEAASGHLSTLRVRDARLTKPLYAVLPDTLPPESPACRFQEFLGEVAKTAGYSAAARAATGGP